MAGQNVPIEQLQSYAFPLQRGPVGYFQQAYGEDCIKQNIAQILGTPTGARIMLPTFGCDIWLLQFEPMDDAMQSMAASSIEKALTLWEPRIQVIDTQVARDDTNLNLVIYTVRYKIVATGAIDSFVGELPLVR